MTIERVAIERVAIIGSGGAGKSVLARRLGEILNLPVIHLDVLFWKPGWVETPADEWRATQQQLVSEPRWIIDGNHAATMDVRLGAADTVVLIDLPRRICFWRVVKRSFAHRGRPRADRAEGCDERLDRQFLRWVWTWPREGRPQALAAIATHAPNARVVTLRSSRDVERWLRDVSRGEAE
jgi:adenylate kinase family enzyme